MENKLLKKRYDKTLSFLNRNVKKGSKILDLGTENPFSLIMKEDGYQVENTQGENLDTDYEKYAKA